jgi:uncharacterized radical SAM superfamily Fe-S cluster-containing enzyme
VCLARIPAERVARGGDIFLEKTCAEHGSFSAVVWRGDDAQFDKWWSYSPPDNAPELAATCCALVEVTSRCDLRCPVCFAGAGDASTEPTVAELYEIFKKLADAGSTFVQISGGEPTARDDLPEIVAAARRAGCETVQLNSNGLRLGREPEFTRALADAGLSFVFLQFDGVTDKTYEKLRGKPILTEKTEAIRVCGENFLGVTLVPTLVPGVNDGEIGDIIDFAVKHSPVVRGVHFQPISYFGRYPTPPRDEDRITLPEVLRGIEAQTAGKFKIKDFNPSACDHPRCGFHGDFVVLPRGKIMKLTKKYNPDACCGADAHLKNRAFVARRWTRSPDAESAAQTEPAADARDMSAFLTRVKSHGFTITAMTFQDAWTLDYERLRRCSLHVFDGASTVQFCARYLTNA